MCVFNLHREKENHIHEKDKTSHLWMVVFIENRTFFSLEYVFIDFYVPVMTSGGGE